MLINVKNADKISKATVKKTDQTAPKIIMYLYPFIASLFPLLFFVNYNKDQLVGSGTDILMLLFLTLIATLAFFLLNLFLFRQLSKASLATFVITILLFSYGHIESLIDEVFPYFNINLSLSAFFPARYYINFDLGTSKILYFLFIAILVATYFKLFKVEKIPSFIHKILLVISIFLVFFNAINFIVYRPDTKTVSKVENREELKSDDYPDIFYIIPDSYARADILKEVYNFDNSNFIEYLQNKGFFVAEKSTTNYAHTFFSLTSSLNMEHVDYLSLEMGEDSQDVSKAISMLSQNKVASYLKEKGYTIVNFSSDSGLTENMNVADYNMQQNEIRIGPVVLKLNQLSLSYLKTTAIYPLFRLNLIEFQRRQVLYVFENIHQLENIEGPKFVTAHIIIPHTPYIFSKDGGLPVDTKKVEDISTITKLYVEQLEFTNTKLKESVEKILAKNKNTIIIIQSDHGPSILLGESFEKNLIPEENELGVKERVSIINAYYFPDGDYSMLTDNISPVNSFRIVLNKYFGRELDMLEDKVFISDYSKVYKLWDVTEMVR